MFCFKHSVSWIKVHSVCYQGDIKSGHGYLKALPPDQFRLLTVIEEVWEFLRWSYILCLSPCMPYIHLPVWNEVWSRSHTTYSKPAFSSPEWGTLKHSVSCWFQAVQIMAICFVFEESIVFNFSWSSVL